MVLLTNRNEGDICAVIPPKWRMLLISNKQQFDLLSLAHNFNSDFFNNN